MFPTRFFRRGLPFALATAALTSALPLAPSVYAQTTAGSLDAGFAVGSVPARVIDAVAAQRDGKVLIGGVGFTSINGVAVNNFVRVNADGSLDTSFKQPALESYDTRTDDVVTATDKNYVPLVAAIVPQADGKILVGGNYYFVNGTPGVGGLLRFNTDGSVDATFKPPRFAGTVYAIVPDADGSYLVGGDFTSVDNVPTSGVVRLKANGRVDSGFTAAAITGVLDAATARNTSVRAIVVQSDGKLILGGTFTNVGGLASPGLARLNRDGSLDGSYQVDARFNAAGTYRTPVAAIYTLALQADGKTLAGGDVFDPDVDPAQSQTEVNGLYRFNSGGSLDATFNPGGTGTNSVVDSMILLPDGGIFLGGDFSRYNGTRAVGYARLLADGTLDPAFDSSVGTNDEVFSLALQNDGKLLLGGFFTVVNGVPVQSVARINTTADVAPAVAVSVGVAVGRALVATPVTKAVFTFSRSGGNLAVPLSIPYTLSGSAQKGSDYKVSGTTPGTVGFFDVNGTVTIPANRTTATLKIKPLGGAVPARKLSVILNLTAPTASFSVGSQTAAVKIVNKSVP